MNNQSLEQVAERVYYEWDRAWAENDIEAFLALYTEDATVESPLIPYLLSIKEGICRGKAAIRKLAELAIPRKPVSRKYYRSKFFTDGKTLMWEYPRMTPTGEQMDFVEIMELQDGLIHYHRVYWGWHGVDILKNDAYYQF